VRRTGPRPLASALDAALRRAAPATLLARVQEAWPRAAGAVVAREAEPVAERGGAVTVACSSAVWAQELELLAPDLVERLNEQLGARAGGGSPVRALRFVTRSG
jgi:predicted nucleic acid-binding Zn ribbon protein